jgi:hypothetical protein
MVGSIDGVLTWRGSRCGQSVSYGRRMNQSAVLSVIKESLLTLVGDDGWLCGSKGEAMCRIIGQAFCNGLCVSLGPRSPRSA